MHSNFLLCFLAYLLYAYWPVVDKQLDGHVWKTVLKYAASYTNSL